MMAALGAVFGTWVLHVTRLMNLLETFVLSSYWLACMFLYIGESQLLADADGGWLAGQGATSASWGEKVSIAFYWSLTSLTTVGYGDITPTCATERGFVMFTLIVSAVFYSLLFANVTTLLQRLDQNNARYNRRMTHVSEICRQYALPKALQRRIRDHARRTSAEYTPAH